jgi:hypothetical protein
MIIDQYVFADILKLSVKMKKKRKRVKKKKVRNYSTEEGKMKSFLQNFLLSSIS